MWYFIADGCAVSVALRHGSRFNTRRLGCTRNWSGRIQLSSPPPLSPSASGRGKKNCHETGLLYYSIFYKPVAPILQEAVYKREVANVNLEVDLV